MLSAGLRKEATAPLHAFIDSFSTLEEKAAWTKSYLEYRQSDRTIRHELYEHVVFPVLLNGYALRDIWSIRWLARTKQNFYRCKKLWYQVDLESVYQLLREHVSAYPDDESRQEILQYMISIFSYAIHEWPTGILCGTNGASLEDCQELLDEVKYVRNLDKRQMYSDFLLSVEGAVREYVGRLSMPKGIPLR